MNAFLLTFERASIFGLAVLIVALVAQLILDGRVPASWRVWLWRVALLQTALALVPPAPLRITVSLPSSLVGAPSRPDVLPMPSLPPVQSEHSDFPSIAPPAVEPVVEVPPPSSSAPISPIQTPRLLGAWIYLVAYVCGLSIQFVVLARCFGRVRHSLRACRPVEEADCVQLREIAQKMRVSPLPHLLKSETGSPYLVGILRPIIVLPCPFLEPHNPNLEAVLTHELAHLKRRDLIWSAVLWLVQSLLWFHPLVWIARRFLALETESACDEMVLSATRTTPASYGILLLNTINSPSTPLTAGITDSFFSIKKRLARLSQATKRPHHLFRVAFVAALCLALSTSLPLRFVARAQPTPRSPVAATVKAEPMGNKYTTGRQIPRDATPETAVGLPASLKDARGNATITGRVVYENGKPAIGMRVFVYCRWLSQTELWGYRRNQANHYRWPDKITKLLSGTAVTRADGTYRFTGLLPQRYGVHLAIDNFGNRAPVGLLAPERSVGVVAIAKQNRRAPNIVLRRSASIRIRVIDQDSSVPLEGVLLRGFTIDDSSGPNLSSAVDAHRRMRPMKGFPSEATTDQNGDCTLSLNAGKTYFFVTGGMYMESPAREQGVTRPFGPPDKIITSNGLYKSDSWCEVTAFQPSSLASQAPRRAWNGETEFQLKKGPAASFVVKLKRYKPLTPAYKSILQSIKQRFHKPPPKKR